MLLLNCIVNVRMKLCIFIDESFFFISEYCCESHINDSLEVRLECIHYMDILIDSILSKSVVGDEMSELFLM